MRSDTERGTACNLNWNLSGDKQCATVAPATGKGVRQGLSDSQHEFPEYMSGSEAFVCLGGFHERIFRGNRNLEPARLDSLIEAGQTSLFRTLDRIKGYYDDAFARLRLRCDSMWECDSTAGAQRVDTTLKCIPRSERKHGVRAVWRETVRRGGDVTMPAIYCCIRA